MKIYRSAPTTKTDSQEDLSTTKGVFLVTTANAMLPVDRDHSVNTYSGISTIPRGSERNE